MTVSLTRLSLRKTIQRNRQRYFTIITANLSDIEQVAEKQSSLLRIIVVKGSNEIYLQLINWFICFIEKPFSDPINSKSLELHETFITNCLATFIPYLIMHLGIHRRKSRRSN